MASGFLLLLLPLSALVEVHSQTVPYVSFMGTDLPNHSYVDLTLGGSVLCHTDLPSCCSSAEGPDRGDWYFPDGSRLPVAVTVLPNTLFQTFDNQRVELRQQTNDRTSGIYHCDIETMAVNNATGRATVYVGLYASGGENSLWLQMVLEANLL